MSLRFPPAGSGSAGTISHDMIRFTPDDTNLVSGMSPLRLGDPSTPNPSDYGVASDRSQIGSLCRHRARRVGDPSAWLDDSAGPYATYYCSCRRDPRLRTTPNTTADDDGGPGTDVAPPDVASAPTAYGTSTTPGVSRPCGHARQHVVVRTTPGGEKIYQERYASSCKYSTFLGVDGEAQSRAARGAGVSVTVDGSGSHAVDHVVAADDSGPSSATADSTVPISL